MFRSLFGGGGGDQGPLAHLPLSAEGSAEDFPWLKDATSPFLEPGERVGAVVPGAWLRVTSGARRYNSASGGAWVGGVRIGSSFGQSESVQQSKLMSEGTVTFTDRRILIAGKSRSQSFWWRDIIDYQLYADGILLQFEDAASEIVSLHPESLNRDSRLPILLVYCQSEANLATQLEAIEQRAPHPKLAELQASMDELRKVANLKSAFEMRRALVEGWRDGQMTDVIQWRYDFHRLHDRPLVASLRKHEATGAPDPFDGDVEKWLDLKLLIGEIEVEIYVAYGEQSAIAPLACLPQLGGLHLTILDVYEIQTTPWSGGFEALIELAQWQDQTGQHLLDLPPADDLLAAISAEHDRILEYGAENALTIFEAAAELIDPALVDAPAAFGPNETLDPRDYDETEASSTDESIESEGSSSDIEARLAKLERLFSAGAISELEYQRTRQRILGEI